MPNRPKPSFPQLNRSHPLAQGLVFDAPLFEGAGLKTNDIVNNVAGTITSSGATWEGGQFGIDLDFSAAASKVSFATPSTVNGLIQLSVELYFYKRGNGGSAFGLLFGKKNSTTSYFAIYNNDGGTDAISLAAGWSTTSGQWWTAAPSLNAWHHLVVTYSFTSTSNNPTIYRNGINQAVTRFGTPAGSPLSDDTVLLIGNNNASTLNWDGKIAYTRIWNRILSAQEVAQLYAHPFQIYKKKTYSIN